MTRSLHAAIDSSVLIVRVCVGVHRPFGCTSVCLLFGASVWVNVCSSLGVAVLVTCVVKCRAIALVLVIDFMYQDP